MFLRLKTLAYRLILCYWPCLWCTGGRVIRLTPDFRRLTVRLRFGVRTRNVVGVIFGGSMYASTDPMYMLMLMRILGREYVVWDKGCTIRFKRPATRDLFAEFEVTDEMLDQVKTGARDHGEITVTWPLALKDDAGVVHAEFEKVLYVARKDFYKEKMKARAARAPAVMALLFLALTLAPRPGHATEPVPFAAKLDRQRARGADVLHVWDRGEHVRAPLYQLCEDQLTMKVDAHAPGGLGRFEHNDTFRIEDSARHLPDLKRWRERTLDAVLEILEPIDRRRGLGNVQMYRARVVSLTPLLDLPNPGDHRLQEAPDNTPVRLRGRVVAVDKNSVTIHSPFYGYRVNLGGVRLHLDGDLGGIIQTPVYGDSVEVGDDVSLWALMTKKHRLIVYPGRPTWLDAPGPARAERYRIERAITAELFDVLDTHVRAADWPAVRIAFGELQRKTLTPDESARLTRAHAELPAYARPLRVAPALRTLVALVDQTFDIDVEEMTAAEVHAFAHRWAQMRVRARAATADHAHDETLIYRLLRKLDFGPTRVIDVAQTAIRHRRRWLELRARTGVRADAAEAREYVVIDESFAALVDQPTPEAVSFVVGACLDFGRRQAQGHRFAARLTAAAVRALDRVITKTRAEDSTDGMIARQILRDRATALHRLAERIGPGGAALARAARSIDF